MSDPELRFEFGRNWLKYIHRNLSQEKIDISKQHILKVLERENLDGLSFLDIGCGSGLHSVAALQAGAAEIYSFDYDPNSVQAAQYVRDRAGNPANWPVIMQGSVLDEAYVRKLPQFDLVYSWGVLHHTGNVWQAVRNAASRVKAGGLFYIALYTADIPVNGQTPEFWLEVKHRYVSSGWLKRRQMEFWYIWRFDLNRRLRNIPRFLKRIYTYKKSRGMNLFTDIRDWLGGWPMEFVHDADAVKFCEAMGFRLKKMLTGEANTEFVFVRNT